MSNTSSKENQSLPAARLTLEDKSFEFPTIIGTENEKAIDISALLKNTGYVTLDEGYVNTGATTSDITFLDGDKGILRYRGYPIEELAVHCDFVEVSYLLIYGELPDKSQLEDPATLARTLHRLSLTLKRTRPLEESISSAGGVRLEAMDDGLMLKALPGVFCAGEMLDWEAPTGGYLLTACFASGHRAGMGAVAWLKALQPV